MDTVKFHPNERVGLADLEAATGKLVMIDQARRAKSYDLPTGRSTGQAATSMRVLEGFGATFPTTTTCKITAGKAILSWLDVSTVRHGVIVGDQAPSDYTLDFSTAAPGDYAVFLRFVYSESSAQNRVFWNPAASPATEEIDNIPTRKIATWEVTYQSASLSPPGNGEWMKIWQVTVSAGPTISGAADFRHFYFEGDANPTDQYKHEWGDGANDRDSNRATYGVTDWHLFSHLVRRQLRDIINQDLVHGYILKPDIDLETLEDEHFGPGAAVDEVGHHKNMEIGGDGRFWKIHTNALTTPARSYFQLTDQEYNAAMAIETEDDGSDFKFLLMQKGPGVAMINGDKLEIRGYSDDQFRIKHEALTDQQITTIFGSGAQTCQVRSGSGESYPGVNSLNGFWYGEDKTFTIFVPARIGSNFSSTVDSWKSNCDDTPEDDIAALSVNVADKSNMQFIHWLPEGCVVNYIDWYWYQASGTSKLRGYAQKVKMTRTTTGYDASPAFTYHDLNTVKQYIEIGESSSAPMGNWSLDRFTCNTGFRSFYQSDQEWLVLTAVSKEAVGNLLFGYRINFTYRWAQPFGPAGG